MIPQTKDLGKVCLTPVGYWNRNNNYERLDVVYCKQLNNSYIAKEDVPNGEDITNDKYWQIVNVIDNKIFEDYDNQLKDKLTEIDNKIIEFENKNQELQDNINTFFDNQDDKFNKFKDDVNDNLDNITTYVTDNINELNNNVNTLNDSITSIRNNITTLDNSLNIISIDTNNLKRDVNDINSSLNNIIENISNGYVLELTADIDGNDDIINLKGFFINDFTDLQSAISNKRNVHLIINRKFSSGIEDTIIIIPSKLIADNSECYAEFLYNKKIYEFIFNESLTIDINKYTIDNNIIIPSTKDYVTYNK